MASRSIPRLRSDDLTTFTLEMARQKLGQPVPESNLVFESNRAVLQQMQRYRPSASLWSYAPEKGASVPAWRVMLKEAGVSCARHCASVLTTLSTWTSPSL